MKRFFRNVHLVSINFCEAIFCNMLLYFPNFFDLFHSVFVLSEQNFICFVAVPISCHPSVTLNFLEVAVADVCHKKNPVPAETIPPELQQL